MIGEDVELRTVLEPSLGNINADPGQIEQVIMNLIVNARDAMPRGGTITIETKNIYLDQTYARHHVSVTPGPHVMLAVTDTGLGMDQETQKRIYEPFLYNEREGQGHRLRFVHSLWNRKAIRRKHLGIQRSGQGNYVQNLSSADK
jgi:signal transduction histidine kinase